MAEIVGVHGVRGAVKLVSHASSPEALFDLCPLKDEKGVREFDIAEMTPVKGHYIATIDGIDDRTAAEKLKGIKLYADRLQFPDLDEGEYYQTDLLGFSVEDTTFAVNYFSGVSQRLDFLFHAKEIC